MIVAVAIAYFLYNAGYWLPFGGGSPGPRFLIPALPFLALGLAPAYRRLPALTLALAIPSVTFMLAGALTFPLIGDNGTGTWANQLGSGSSGAHRADRARGPQRLARGRPACWPRWPPRSPSPSLATPANPRSATCARPSPRCWAGRSFRSSAPAWPGTPRRRWATARAALTLVAVAVAASARSAAGASLPRAPRRARAAERLVAPGSAVGERIS